MAIVYRVEFAPQAIRDFRKLERHLQKKLKPHIDRLAENPFPQNIKKLAGDDDFYRIRVGDYRIVYQVQKKILLVLVVKIGHRKDVYR